MEPPRPTATSDPGHSASDARGVATALGAVAAAAVVFVFRLLAQGQLTNDHYMHLALAQQVLLGEVPGRDFVDPGMPLMYSLSALVQYFWPGPFSEVVLTSGLVGMAAATTYALVALMTRSWFWPAVAVVIEVALWPRLYSYPKVLVPALLLLAWWQFSSRRSSQAMWAVAGCTVIGILLRHDLGAFAFLAVTAAISASGNLARPRLRTWLQYVLFTGVLLAPYQLFVEGFGGLAEHIREGFEFSKSDAHQLLFAWSELPELQLFPFHRNEAAVLLYYTSWLLVLVGALHAPRRHQREDAVLTSTIVAAITFLGCYIVMIMRHPIVTRVPDAAAILAVLTVYCTADTIRHARMEFSSPHRIRALVAAAVVVLLCVGTVTSAATLGGVTQRFHDTRLSDGVAKARERLSALAHVGSVWPWSWYWPNGDLPDVIRYLSACTSPDDRVLVTWAAPEYFYYAQRGFGAGHALFIPRTFESAADRQKIVERLGRERVPIALINESSRDEFARAYPELEAYLSVRYFAVGHFTRGSSRITVVVRDGVVASGSFADSGWPCGFESFGGIARDERSGPRFNHSRVRFPLFRANGLVPGAM